MDTCHWITFSVEFKLGLGLTLSPFLSCSDVAARKRPAYTLLSSRPPACGTLQKQTNTGEHL